MPGAIPLESIQGSAYEEKIILKWREPAQTYGIIIQYEVYKQQGYQTVTDIDHPSEWKTDFVPILHCFFSSSSLWIVCISFALIFTQV